MNKHGRWGKVVVVAAVFGVGVSAAACSSSSSPSGSTGKTGTSGSPFLTTLGKPAVVASTVPSNGDVNPYGIALIPTSAGKLTAGSTLVSNFNDKANVQGTGTTIEQVSPHGKVTTFAAVSSLPSGDKCPGGVGLGAGLAILPGGWVVVGSSPSVNTGTPPATYPAGCLIIFNSNGTVAETISTKNIDEPWDLVASVSGTKASIFVSNAFGGTTSYKKSTPEAGLCSIDRVDLSLKGTSAPTMTGTTVVGNGFPWKTNHTTFVIAPTGLAISSNGTLYVDDTETNSISSIAGALTRTTPVSADQAKLTTGGDLTQPLGMALTPNGDILVMNGGNGNIAEVAPTGKQVLTKTLFAKGAGQLFDVVLFPTSKGILFGNDGTNSLDAAKITVPTTSGAAATVPPAAGGAY